MNIIVLFAIFMQNDKTNIDANDPFDTEYVIGLLQKEEKLVKTVRDLNVQLADSLSQLTNTQTQLEQTQILIGQSIQKYRACEAEKLIIIEDARDQVREQQSRPASAPVCDAEKLEVSIAQAKVVSLENLVSEIREKFTQTQEELVLKNQLISQIQNKENTELQALKLEIDKLKQVLNEPIALESHYLSARFCSKPKFESLICVEEFLVRPSFTKPPITRLSIKVLDKSGTVVANGEFNSAQSVLYRLSLGRGQELPSGAYMVQYSVDNETLLSPLVELRQ